MWENILTSEYAAVRFKISLEFKPTLILAQLGQLLFLGARQPRLAPILVGLGLSPQFRRHDSLIGSFANSAIGLDR